MQPNEVKVQIVVDKRVAQRLDKLAETLGVNRSQMGAIILDEATSGPDWIMQRVGVRMAAGFKAMLGTRKRVEVVDE